MMNTQTEPCFWGPVWFRQPRAPGLYPASTCRASALPLLWERRWHRAGKPVASGGCSPKPLLGRRCPSFAAPHAASGSISGPV